MTTYRDHKRAGSGFFASEGPREYGFVNHPTCPHFRNYHREIPGGYSFLDLMTNKIGVVREAVADQVFFKINLEHGANIFDTEGKE